MTVGRPLSVQSGVLAFDLMRRFILFATTLITLMVLIRVLFSGPIDRSFLARMAVVPVLLGLLVLATPILNRACAAEDRMWRTVRQRLLHFTRRTAKPS
jgi:hypothetical protein